jgi:DNA invertase Pin-like site-specific DNA recombinase
MKVGYARISTPSQTFNLQTDALEKAGCEKIFFDTGTGVRHEREGMKEMLNFFREGDVVIVWKLDRLGRSIRNLIDLTHEIKKRGASFISLSENIDTTTISGKLVFHIFGALAEFERDLLIERTTAGLEAARARGRVGGRRFRLNEEQVCRLKELYQDKKMSIDEICRVFNITPPTLYKYMKRSGLDIKAATVKRLVAVVK